MNSLNLKNITENLIDTFLYAGKVAKDISQKGVKIVMKPDQSPVTDGDLEVDKILKIKIKSLTKEIPIISEESVNFNIKNNDKNFWLIDPIDGTKDYINKKDEYTLNAALIVNLKPALGIVYAPSKERLFFSYGKEHAYEINGKNRKKLDCQKVDIKNIIALANSDKTPSEVLEIYNKHKVSKIVKMSSSLKFCILAAGEADIYAAKARAFEWDIAAGHAILEHAGGTITDHNGKIFSYGKENYKNLPIIAKRSENIN